MELQNTTTRYRYTLQPYFPKIKVSLIDHLLVPPVLYSQRLCFVSSRFINGYYYVMARVRSMYETVVVQRRGNEGILDEELVKVESETEDHDAEAVHDEQATADPKPAALWVIVVFRQRSVEETGEDEGDGCGSGAAYES